MVIVTPIFPDSCGNNFERTSALRFVLDESFRRDNGRSSLLLLSSSSESTISFLCFLPLAARVSIMNASLVCKSSRKPISWAISINQNTTRTSSRLFVFLLSSQLTMWFLRWRFALVDTIVTEIFVSRKCFVDITTSGFRRFTGCILREQKIYVSSTLVNLKISR